MTNPSISLLLGTLFVLLGALNVWLIFHASKALTASRMSRRLIKAHRLGGYLFIALFCVMTAPRLALCGASAYRRRRSSRRVEHRFLPLRTPLAGR
jgi:hypothetical protein